MPGRTTIIASTIASETSQPTSGHPRWSPRLFALLLLAVAAITFFREPPSYLRPPLAYEDGREMLAFYYNHPQPGSILRDYNGYVSLVPNLVGYLAVRLPVTWAPRALALAPLAFASLAFAWLYLPVYRRFLPHDSARLLLGLLLALWPVGNDLFVANTAYSAWNLLLLLVWLTLAPPPAQPLSAGLRLTAMAALIASHPLSLALAPLFLAALVRHLAAPRLSRVVPWLAPQDPTPARRRGAVAFYAALLLAAVLYRIYGIDTGGVHAPPPLDTARLAVRFLVERVLFGTLAGDRAAVWLYREGHGGLVFGLGLLAAVALAAALALGRRRLTPSQGGFALAIAYLAAALTTGFVVARAPSLEVLDAGQAVRYFWIQRLLLVALLSTAGWALFAPHLRRLSRGTLSTLQALLLVYVVLLNLANNGSYASKRRWGHEMAAFTREVARQEEAGQGVDARLERGMWSVELRRDAATEP